MLVHGWSRPVLDTLRVLIVRLIWSGWLYQLPSKLQRIEFGCGATGYAVVVADDEGIPTWWCHREREREPPNRDSIVSEVLRWESNPSRLRLNSTC